MSLLSLLNKAKFIFIIVLVVYILSYGAGYVAGKLDWVDYRKLKNSAILKFSSNLEYKVPGYGWLLKEYKQWHDKLRDKYLAAKDYWGMDKLIFFNNWIVSNITYVIRSVFVAPISLSIFGKFFQGAIFAQVPGSSRISTIFLSEFGGYYLVTSATLCLVLWIIFYKAFRFITRRRAFISGLKILGLAYAVSAIAMIIGSLIETKFIMSIFENLKL
jgi:hypothetical protein